MAKWSLMVERANLRGEVAFHDTGRVIETEDPHAAVMAEQAKDGRSYSAQPAAGGWPAALPRLLRRLLHF